MDCTCVFFVSADGIMSMAESGDMDGLAEFSGSNGGGFRDSDGFDSVGDFRGKEVDVIFHRSLASMDLRTSRGAEDRFSSVSKGRREN